MNGSLTPENVTEIVHEAEAEVVTTAPHVPTTTPAPSQVATPTPAANDPAPEQQQEEAAPTNHTDGEEIPSFNEWAQKQLEEAEKRKGMHTTSYVKIETLLRQIK